MVVVMPREGHGSRNITTPKVVPNDSSCPARGMGVEIGVDPDTITVKMSCPARGMGVEIPIPVRKGGVSNGHAPRGAWE